MAKLKGLLKVGDLEYEIRGDPLLVTNSIEGQIIIDDASIDRQHAILLEAPGTGDLSLLSLFTALGTFMHGELMVPMLSTLLSEGVHSIRFGDVETTIEVFAKEPPSQTAQQLLPSCESGIHESATDSTTDYLEGALQVTASTSMADPSIAENVYNSTANVSIPESVNNSTADGSKLNTSHPLEECYIPETQAVIGNEGLHDTNDSKENPYESQFRICTQDYNEDMGHMTQPFGAMQSGNVAECMDEGEMAELLGIITPCGTAPLSGGDDAFSRVSTPDLPELAGEGPEASLTDVAKLVQDKMDENSKIQSKTQEQDKEKDPLTPEPTPEKVRTELHKDPECEGNLETSFSLDRSCTPDLDDVAFKKPFAKAPPAPVFNDEDDLCFLPTQVFPIHEPNADTVHPLNPAEVFVEPAAPKPMKVAMSTSVQVAKRIQPEEPTSPLASTQAFRADIAATSTPSGDGSASHGGLPNVALVSPLEASAPASSTANVSPLPPTQVFKQEVVTPIQTPPRRRSILQLRGTPSTSRFRASAEPSNGEEKRQQSEPREFGVSPLVKVKKETSLSQDSPIRRSNVLSAQGEEEGSATSVEKSLGRPKRSKRSHKEESERENDKEEVKSRPVRKQSRKTLEEPSESTAVAKEGSRVKKEAPSECKEETENQGRPTRKKSRQERVAELQTSNEQKEESQKQGSSRATRRRTSAKEEIVSGSQKGKDRRTSRRNTVEDPSLDKQHMKKEDSKEGNKMKDCKEDNKMQDSKEDNKKKKGKEKADKKKQEGKEDKNKEVKKVGKKGETNEKEEKKVGNKQKDGKDDEEKKEEPTKKESKPREDRLRSRSRSHKESLPAEPNKQEQTEAIAAKNKRKQSTSENTAKRRRQGSESQAGQASKQDEPRPSDTLNASTSLETKLKTGKKWKVCFTAVDVRLVEKYSCIDAGPWKVVQDPTKCNVLVMDEPMRTFKFLVAMARGVPIYRSKWLDAMIANGSQLVDPTPFLFVSKELERKYKFSLWNSLDAASKGKLLDGYQFVTTPGIVPSQSDMEVIIKCAGGVTLPDLKDPAVDPNRVHLISDEKQRRLWPALRRNCKSLRIIPTEAIMIAIMRQSVEPLSQRLS